MKIAYIFESGRIERLKEAGLAEGTRRNGPVRVPASTEGRLPSEFFYGAFEFAADGHEVDLIQMNCLPDPPAWGKWLSKRIPEACLPVRINSHDLRRCSSLVPLLFGYDVIISTTDSIGLTVGFIGEINRIPAKKVTIHCKLTDYHPRGWKRWLTRRILKQTIPVLFGPGEVTSIMRGYGIKEAEIKVAPFGVDTDYWTPAAQMEPGDYFLAIGNDAHRDFDCLLRVAARLDFPLKLITRKKLHEPIPPHVEVISGSYQGMELSDQAMRDLYLRARAVVVPLLPTFQPSGQSVTLQAQACGKPVIIAKTSGIWDDVHLKDKTNVFFYQPEDEGHLEQVIREVLQLGESLDDVAEAARAYVREHGSIGEFSQRMKSVIPTI